MSGGSLALALPTLTPPPTGILSPVGGGVSHGRSSDAHTPANRDFKPCWWGGEPRKDIVLF